MMKIKNSFKQLYEDWYFIRQDIVSYGISSILYIFLCLISNYNIQSFIYSLFDCLFFYVSFWFIRVNFDNTYHSNEWSFCKLCTRLMLISGVFILWILPIRFSLFNGLFVAFMCCFILYLIAIEVDKKKALNNENKELTKRLNHKDIYAMNEDELYEHCRKCGLSDVDCKIAYFIVIERLKGKELYEAINYSERQTKRKRKEILDKIK